MKTTFPSILRVGSAKFARNAAALVESLFDPSGTASGTYKVRSHSVLFSLPNGEPFACLVANRHHERFFVSAGRQRDGRTFYSYGLTDSDRARLGLTELSYSAQGDEAARVWGEVNALHTVSL